MRDEVWKRLKKKLTQKNREKYNAPQMNMSE